MAKITWYTNEGEPVEGYSNEIVHCKKGELMPYAGPEAGWYILNGPVEDPGSGTARGPFKTEMEAVDYLANRDVEFLTYIGWDGREHAEF